MTSKGHDVVVIGGGHNGLVAGCYLARAGRRVLVIERQELLGGMTLSAPLIGAAPQHLVNPGAYENVYLRAGGVVEDLDLARHGYREVDSVGWAWLGEGGESLFFQPSVDATARDIARFSDADARAYRELIEVAVKALALQAAYASSQPTRPSPRLVGRALRSLTSDRALRSTLGGLLTGTAVDAITSTFASDQMRGAFASIATILGAPTAEGSALAMLGTSSLHWKGAARPIGGMGGLVTALTACLRSHGGEIRTASPVARVTTTGGRTTGVYLEDGTTISAPVVVSAIPPQRVPDLVDGALPAAVTGRMRAAPANAGGVATLTVNLALDGKLELPAHERSDVDIRKPALFTGSLDGVLVACADAARGEISERPAWWCTIFTAMDPSQAPEGQDTVQLYGPVPVSAQGGWDARRNEATDMLIDQIAEVAPNVRDREIGRYVESPDDLTRRTTTVNGCLYHVDHLATRIGPLRPALGAGGYRTALAGFYITGAGCHPSGGVSGLPGKLAAEVVLADRPRRRSR